jgi:plasmid maintenance system antidote protein VapI
MKKYEKIYQDLRKEYSDEEIVESMLIPEDLTDKERKELSEEMKIFRFKLLNEQTEEQRIFSDIMRFKFQMEDYIINHKFIINKSFGNYLEEYVRILRITKKNLSENLNIHYTKLSRLFNNRESPNIEFLYRLEKHSGNLVPAIMWWKLVIKKQEYNIKKDKIIRKKEAAKVEKFVTYSSIQL